MRLKVYGQVGDGPIMTRTVSVAAFVTAWGRWARAVASATASRPLVMRDRKVWTEVVE